MAEADFSSIGEADFSFTEAGDFSFVKGTGFSPYISLNTGIGALAPEADFLRSAAISLSTRSINPKGNPSLVRKRRSFRAISPASASWSYPARCSNPCSISTLNSTESRCPCSAACRAAVSTEIARSPATPKPASAGNESTSVALFFFRKRRFSPRIPSSVVSRTETSPLRPTTACASRR